MLTLASVTVAQPQGRGGQRDGQRGGMFDPARMRQMMEQRMKEQLGATDAEWQVLGPRLTKVMNLSRQTGGGMGRMMMGRRGRQGGPQGGPQDQQRGDRRGGRGPFGGGEPTAVDTAAEALQTTLSNTEATPEDIKAKLTAFRSAKEKAKQELAKAQQDLRQVLTLRQEAQLVLMGMLD
jgi:hypothetical protein